MFLPVLKLVVVLLLALSLTDSGEKPSPEAQLLAGATIFKLGPVGFAGQVSDEEAALVKLLDAPDTAAQLARLLAAAKFNEGRLYALCGLRKRSPTDYDNAIAVARWQGE